MANKIAVKVSNQQEYDAFAECCEKDGYRRSVVAATGFDKSFCYMAYQHGWIGHTLDCVKHEGYEIISFPTFAKLKGIEIPKNKIIIETANYTIEVERNRAVYTPKHSCDKQLFFLSEITEIYTALKSLENE